MKVFLLLGAGLFILVSAFGIFGLLANRSTTQTGPQWQLASPAQKEATIYNVRQVFTMPDAAKFGICEVLELDGAIHFRGSVSGSNAFGVKTKHTYLMITSPTGELRQIRIDGKIVHQE